jgi:hypothetical protein
MPKKTATARGAAQRNKPKVKVQKSFELVRQATDSDEQEQELETASSVESTAVSVSTMATPEVKQEKSRPAREPKQSESKSSPAGEVKQDESVSSETSAAPKGSAAARLAARRNIAHKAQQRAAATLITAEHYAYVRRDLVFIAILAAIMFCAIIILHFVPGIGS